MKINTEIIKTRLEKLRALMTEKNLDAFVLIVDERANSESCHYISGFRGSSAALIIDMNEEILVTDGRYLTQSKNQSPFKIIIQSELSLPEYIASAVKNSDFKHVGFEAEKISHATFQKYFEPVKTQWTDSSDLILNLRRTKDAYEISMIRKAAKISREAFGNVLKKTHAGMSEIEFEIKLMEEIKLL